jgi:hypothetical protein
MGFSARADTTYVYPAGRSVIRQHTIYDFNGNCILDYETDGANYTGWLIKPAATYMNTQVTIGIPGSDAFTLIELEMRRQSDGSLFYNWNTAKGENQGSGDTFAFTDARLIMHMEEPMWVREYVTLTAGGSVAVPSGSGDVYCSTGTFLPF